MKLETVNLTEPMTIGNQEATKMHLQLHEKNNNRPAGNYVPAYGRNRYKLSYFLCLL